MSRCEQPWSLWAIASHMGHASSHEACEPFPHLAAMVCHFFANQVAEEDCRLWKLPSGGGFEGYFAHFEISKHMQTRPDSLQTSCLQVNIHFKWTFSENSMVCISDYVCFVGRITSYSMREPLWAAQQPLYASATSSRCASASAS